MTLYQYKALSQSGEKLSGEIEALDRRNVLEELDKLGHYPVEVIEAPQSGSASSGLSLPFMNNAPKAAQITLFTRELALLLKAGLPLDKALAMLLQDMSSTNMRPIVEKLLKSVNDGKSVYEAMKAIGSFPPVYVNMIRVAEASGTLDVVLERIAETREKEEKIRAKATSALLYPSFLVVTAIAAIIVMLVYVVPSFKDLILNSGGDIPASSRLVIDMSDWLIANGVTLAITAGATIFILPVLWKNTAFRQSIDNILFVTPLIGHLMRLNLTIRFCRTLGSLLENGVDLPQAMNLSREVLGVPAAEKAVAEAGEALRKGQNFIDPLAKSELFPPVVINMLRVGEERGNLSNSSLYMADMFEEKLETAIQRTLTIIEPVIILIVSIFVAGIIISIIGSVLSINDLAM